MEKEELQKEFGVVLTTAEATAEFVFVSFCAPFVVVRRRRDGMKGTLRFQHRPRFYFDFKPAE